MEINKSQPKSRWLRRNAQASRDRPGANLNCRSYRVELVLRLLHEVYIGGIVLSKNVMVDFALLILLL